MDDLRTKKNCECLSCLQNEFNCWREFACRILKGFSFIQKEKWFKTPEGKEYLTKTFWLRNQITRTRGMDEKKTKGV